MAHLLADWLADPTPIVVSVVGVAIVALLYWRGARYSRRQGIGRRVGAWRSWAFAGGLLALLIAIASPLDALADRSLAAHMAQHALIVLVAAPLLLLGEPFWPVWRALPTDWRRELLRWMMRRYRLRRAWGVLEALARRAWVTLLVFLAVFLIWHLPQLYDAALRIEVIHAMEHASFLVVALLFWAQVIPLTQMRRRLSYLQRSGYVFVAGLALHFFAVMLAVAYRPIYTFYGSGASAAANQDAAAAVMDVSGMVVFTITLMILLGLWLYEEDRSDVAAPAPAPLQVAGTGGALLLLEANEFEAAATTTNEQA